MDNTSGFLTGSITFTTVTAPQVFYFAPQNKWYLIFAQTRSAIAAVLLQ